MIHLRSLPGGLLLLKRVERQLDPDHLLGHPNSDWEDGRSRAWLPGGGSRGQDFLQALWCPKVGIRKASGPTEEVEAEFPSSQCSGLEATHHMAGNPMYNVPLVGLGSGLLRLSLQLEVGSPSSVLTSSLSLYLSLSALAHIA